MDITAVQTAIREQGVDGWLLYDFRGSNMLALRIVGHADEPQSRRVAAFIPATGEPRVLVHAIEKGAWSNVPGTRRVYLKWEEFREGVAWLVGDAGKIAMEYAPMGDNPYISRIDAGTVELVRSCGPEIVSSGDLVQHFEATWDESQWELHQEASKYNQEAFEIAWQFIADKLNQEGSVGEYEVQQYIMDFFERNGLETYHPPIVGVNENSGNPHYEPLPGKDSQIKKGDFVLLDIWCKMSKPNAVYSDLTKVGFAGSQPSEKHEEIFRIVAEARDAGIAIVEDAFNNGKSIRGWQVDDAVRHVIEEAGYGQYFIHRTGHNMGQETHGNGAHIDNLETRDDRKLLPGTCFTIEPGIYLPEFGVRLEIDIFLDWQGHVHVTGGVQTEIHKFLA